jgi:hypothetical protein
MGGIEKLPKIQKEETRPEDADEELPVIGEEEYKTVIKDLGYDEGPPGPSDEPEDKEIPVISEEDVKEISNELEDRELRSRAMKGRSFHKSNKGKQMSRGFTQIPHEWLELLANKEDLPLTADELRVMLLIFRESYGRNGRKPLNVRWQTIKRERFVLITGIPDRSIRRIIHNLERDELINVVRTAHCKGKNWRFKPNEELIEPKKDDYS